MSANVRQPLPRFALLILVLLVASGGVGALAFGADPDSGTVSLDQPQAQWKGKEFPAGGATMLRQLCDVPELCDEYTLTADIDPAHWKSADGGAEVVIAWEDTNDDFDLYVLDAAGTLVGSSANADTTSERVMITDANRDAGPYRVVVNPYSVDAGSGYDGGVLVVDRASVAPGTGEVPLEPVSGLRCENGVAGGIFPCDNVDLEGFLPISSLGEAEDVTGDPVHLNDIWGWTDPQTRREYAIVGKTTGTAFVDITDPRAPRYLGSLPSAQRVPVAGVPVATIFKTWRDIKVYENHAFIVSEEPTHGMQVFDLTRLRGVTEPQAFDEDASYRRPLTPDAMGNSHNIAINEDSGFAYAIGTDTCEGGPHMIDIREPKSPKFAGCVAEDGYTHDTQCVNYDGPDTRFAGREICFNANEDTVTIVDVTDKSAPKQLSRVTYDGASYTHQGWLTADGRHFLVNDELDEQGSGANTTTRVFDVGLLDRPVLKSSHVHSTESIDHNLYTRGNDVFEANYRSGLRWLDATGIADGKLTQKGFFDIYPADDAAEFNGAWSNYPYYDSGLVVVSGIEQGLFVLRPHGSAPPAAAAAATPAAAKRPPAAATRGATTSGPPACAASTGLRSASAKPSGRGARLSFTRGVANPVTVDVFQHSRGSHIAQRLVARFTGRSDDVRWNGRNTVPGRRVRDGYLSVRFTMRTPQGLERRRVVLQRSRGKLRRRGTFERAAGCDLLTRYKLERPVFGGRRRTSLGLSYRVARRSIVSVAVLRGSRVVKRLRTRTARARTTYRLRVSARDLRRGEYRFRITAVNGKERVVSTLRARRL